MNMIAELSRWMSWGRAAERQRPALSDPMELPCVDERPLGCGWFDSSHELRSGLVVREHNSADTLWPALPLSDWLEFHLEH